MEGKDSIDDVVISTLLRGKLIIKIGTCIINASNQ